jgi:hypothetical protein
MQSEAGGAESSKPAGRLAGLRSSNGESTHCDHSRRPNAELGIQLIQSTSAARVDGSRFPNKTSLQARNA